MKPVRVAGAVVVLTFMIFVGACSSKQATSCAGASTVEVVAPAVLTAFPERGGGGSSGGGGGGGHASSSGGVSSGGRGTGGSSGASGSKIGSSSSGRGTGSSAGSSGAKPAPIPVTGSGSKTVTYRSPSGSYSSVRIPTQVGSSYSYAGHSYSYHPESYWMHIGPPDPWNPYDQRNFTNPYSPYYGYHLAVSGC